MWVEAEASGRGEEGLALGESAGNGVRGRGGEMALGGSVGCGRGNSWGSGGREGVRVLVGWWWSSDGGAWSRLWGATSAQGLRSGGFCAVPVGSSFSLERLGSACVAIRRVHRGGVRALAGYVPPAEAARPGGLVEAA